MQIKGADDRQPDIDALERLRDRPGLDSTTHQRIEREIATLQAGIRGERDAAYEIEFHYAKASNRVTIHDLRLEIDGRVAQIDHLIIDRLLTVWVCESKHFAEGVGVDDHGEWVRFWNGHPTGIPSPVEQNRRHITVLRDAFAQGLVALPRRMGIAVKPDLRDVVLVSNSARIKRPRSKAAVATFGLDKVFKVERLKAILDEDTEKRSLFALRRFITEDELHRFGQGVVALHRPAPTRDWAQRFGLGVPTQAVAPSADATVATVPTARSRRGRDSGQRCAVCGTPVSVGVARFSEENAVRFGGRILCMTCQTTAGAPPPR